MDKKHLTIFVIAIIALLAIVFVSSALLRDNTNKNPNQLDVGSKETFSISTNGGHHSALDDIVEIDVQAGSVSEPVNITVESISNPVEDTTLHMFSCFEFGPDGFVFEEPIDLIIHYNPNEIPEEVEESDVQIYLLNSGVWEPIVGSFANENMDYAVASVSHFSKMGCGASPATSSSDEPTGNDGSDDEDDGSAQYWFKAELNYYTIKSPRLVDWDDDDMYSVGVSAHWKPVSYVQYYEIKFVFNGNLPEDYGWGCDFREQSKSYCYPGPYPLNEGYIYHMGGDPEIEGFLSVIKTGEWTASVLNEDTGKMESVVYGNGWPLGDDGYSFLGVNTVVSDDEELSANAIGSIVSQMETFVHQYVNGWEVWVRGVTETQ
jgi:hypothetical protein